MKRNLIQLILMGIFISLTSMAYALDFTNFLPINTPPNEILSREINSGGIVADDEIICDSGVPNGILNVTAPMGDIEGFLILQWELKTEGGTWTPIFGANLLDYYPTSISQTTFYRRACRESLHQPWKYSNVVTKKVVEGIKDMVLITTNVTCKYGSDGKAKASPVGGEPGYTYLWSNSSTDPVTVGLAAGYYQVTITDANGCIKTSDYIHITEPALAVAANKAFEQEPYCPGGDDGILALEAHNGVEPYHFIWSDGTIGDTKFWCAAGTYSAIVTDAHGCETTLTDIVLGGPEEFALEENTVSVSCFGRTDGAIEFELNGGTSPYDYYWEDGSLSSTYRSGLRAGNYSVVAIDFNGCFFEKTVEIPQPEKLLATHSSIQNKICNSSANIVPTGGTTPYSFEWENGSTSGFITDLCPGVYNVDITDHNGCKTQETIEITNSFIREVILIKLEASANSQTGKVKITLPYEEIASIRTYTMAGDLVEVYDNIESEEKTINITLDISKYQEGIYLINVTSGKLTATEKMLISNN